MVGSIIGINSSHFNQSTFMKKLTFIFLLLLSIGLKAQTDTPTYTVTIDTPSTSLANQVNHVLQYVNISQAPTGILLEKVCLWATQQIIMELSTPRVALLCLAYDGLMVHYSLHKPEHKLHCHPLFL